MVKMRQTAFCPSRGGGRRLRGDKDAENSVKEEQISFVVEKVKLLTDL